MKKTEFIEKTKGQFNSIRSIGKYKIRCRSYDNLPWAIVADSAETGDGKDFRELQSLEKFSTREDLWKFIKQTI